MNGARHRQRIRRRAFLAGAGAIGLAAVAAPVLLARGSGRRAPGFRLLLAGDIFHGDSYERGGAKVIAAHGYDYSMEKIRPLLGRADYVVANFEAAATRRSDTPLQGKHFLHRTDPVQAPQTYARSGIRALTLANNHSMDFGPEGLFDTFAALQAQGIRFVGAGPNLDVAETPLILKVPSPDARPRHVGIFASFESRPAFDAASGFYATATAPGVARLDPARFEALAARYRKQYPDLFVVAFPHWGKNYAWRTPAQAELGRALVDAGADLVIGHHGHNFQEIERYKGKWILYGIGNFLFNSVGRWTQFGNMPPYGLAVELDLPLSGGEDVLARVYPILADNGRTRYQPAVAQGREAQAALATLLDRSEMSLGRWNMDLETDELGPHLLLGA